MYKWIPTEIYIYYNHKIVFTEKLQKKKIKADDIEETDRLEPAKKEEEEEEKKRK